MLVYARHFLATEPAAGPLTVDRRARLVTVHSFSGVLPLFDASSDPQVCRAAGTVRHLDQVSSGIYSRVLAALAAALVGAYVALAVLLIVAVLRVVRPRLDGHR